MKKAFVLSIVFSLAVPGIALSAPWEFDPVHTGVQFKVRHLMVSNVGGDFEKLSGKITYDDSDVTKSTAEIAAPMPTMGITRGFFKSAKRLCMQRPPDVAL